jgi:hypothetical protein
MAHVAAACTTGCYRSPYQAPLSTPAASRPHTSTGANGGRNPARGERRAGGAAAAAQHRGIGLYGVTSVRTAKGCTEIYQYDIASVVIEHFLVMPGFNYRDVGLMTDLGVSVLKVVCYTPPLILVFGTAIVHDCRRDWVSTEVDLSALSLLFSLTHSSLARSRERQRCAWLRNFSKFTQ